MRALTRFEANVGQMTDPANIEDSVLDAVDAINAAAMIYGQGLIANRPTAGIRGRFYIATDQSNTVYYDNGSSWIEPLPHAQHRWQPGDLKWSMRSTPESGWYKCDSSEILASGDTALAAICGPLFGTTDGSGGAGSSHFKLPPAASRALIAAGTGAGLSARALGAILGAETHKLSAAESGMPTHGHADNIGFGNPSHSLWAVDHVHGPQGGANFVIRSAGGSAGFGSGSHSITTGSTATAGSGNVSVAGSITQGAKSGGVSNASGVAAASAHENMPPSLVGNLFIKR